MLLCRPAAAALGLSVFCHTLSWVTAAVVRSQPAELSKDGDLRGSGSRDRYNSFANQGFVRKVRFRHRLRICNAYPSDASFDIFLGKSKLSNAALAYKSCEEFDPKMSVGDRLEFHLGGVSAGTFSVSGMPNNDAVLVVVIYRHDALSRAVAFESHVFANLINAQIAVLDTFKGNTRASLKIQDSSTAKTSRSEELRFDSVVAVNPGMYEIVAEDGGGQMKARQELVALNRESYVVVRIGVEAEEGESFPQELLVFPRSDPKVLMGAASRPQGMQALALALALAVAAVVPAMAT